MLHILVVLIDVRKWLAVTRVIDIRSRVDEAPLSAIRSACAELGGARYFRRDQVAEQSGHRSSTNTPQVHLSELLLVVQFTRKCSNGRKFDSLIYIGRNVAGRSPVIDGPCGCHPP
jgi:hypothetical protein